MADKNMIGMDLGKGSIEIEKGRLRFFAKAIGETSAPYIDETAARDEGHRSLPAPPTFIKCLATDVSNASGLNRMKVLGVDLGRILHAEQGFEHHGMAYAGDTLHFETTLTDVYDKKDGALHFIVTTTRVTNQDGAHVADLRSTIVERRG
jgi:acyl dehydratase